MKRLVLKIIQIYQITISPDHGFFSYYGKYSGCRFFPTCSQYAYQAIKQQGLLKGLISAVKRVFRCHPFSSGGYDPVAHPETLVDKQKYV